MEILNLVSIQLLHLKLWTTFISLCDLEAITLTISFGYCSLETKLVSIEFYEVGGYCIAL